MVDCRSQRGCTLLSYIDDAYNVSSIAKLIKEGDSSDSVLLPLAFALGKLACTNNSTVQNEANKLRQELYHAFRHRQFQSRRNERQRPSDPPALSIRWLRPLNGAVTPSVGRLVVIANWGRTFLHFTRFRERIDLRDIPPSGPACNRDQVTVGSWLACPSVPPVAEAHRFTAQA